MTKKSTRSFPTNVFRARKSALTRSFVRALVLLGALAATPAAHAINTDHAGSICHNYYAAQATWIQAYPNGTRSVSPNPTYVICPLTRNTSNSNGAKVLVDLAHFGTQTTQCTAYSYNYNGALLASHAASWTGSGANSLTLNLSGAGKSNAWSNYSVLCRIPGSSAGQLYDVDVAEN